MENLYIKIVDDQPYRNPVLESNLLQVFGSIPDGWAPFNRIQQPTDILTNPFQVAVNTYTLSSDGVTWQDTWTTRDMTADEKSALIASYQNNPPGPNMTLDTSTLQWSPNTPKPTDGQQYRWDLANGIWVIRS